MEKYFVVGIDARVNHDILSNAKKNACRQNKTLKFNKNTKAMKLRMNFKCSYNLAKSSNFYIFMSNDDQ